MTIETNNKPGAEIHTDNQRRRDEISVRMTLISFGVMSLIGGIALFEQSPIYGALAILTGALLAAKGTRPSILRPHHNK